MELLIPKESHVYTTRTHYINIACIHTYLHIGDQHISILWYNFIQNDRMEWNKVNRTLGKEWKEITNVLTYIFFLNYPKVENKYMHTHTVV